MDDYVDCSCVQISWRTISWIQNQGKYSRWRGTDPMLECCCQTWLGKTDLWTSVLWVWAIFMRYFIESSCFGVLRPAKQSFRSVPNEKFTLQTPTTLNNVVFYWTFRYVSVKRRLTRATFLLPWRSGHDLQLCVVFVCIWVISQPAGGGRRSGGRCLRYLETYGGSSFSCTLDAWFI